jgi:signal transduction histidine kinase
MKRRANVIGGKLELSSTKGRGVTVVCTVSAPP